MWYHLFVAVRGKNETISISYSDTSHANIIPQSVMKEIQIEIQVIAKSNGSKILILHLWMRNSMNRSFEMADF
jgi:hypothetical protein